MHMQLRYLCTSARLQSQLGNIINKVMNSDQTKKSRNKSLSHNNSIGVALPSVFTNSKQTHKNRRVTVLNKIFMKHITDLMATGEVAPKLLGKGIEITHVNFASDFSVVNVYWIAHRQSDENNVTEHILKVSAGHLQHELTQLRVIGRVPTINFVKNKKYNVVREVEERLAQVDFGEDFIPSAHLVSHNTIPVLKTTISDKVKQQLSELNKMNSDENEEEDHEISIPEMRQDVLGFDHGAIIAKVKNGLKKAKAAEEKLNSDIPEYPTGSQDTSDEVSSFLASKENEVFDDFLKKRLADERRKKRAMPFFESKLEAETIWHDTMENKEVNDIPIEEEYRDEYRDIERH